jgi:hypothetical protein
LIEARTRREAIRSGAGLLVLLRESFGGERCVDRGALEHRHDDRRDRAAPVPVQAMFYDGDSAPIACTSASRAVT